MRGNSFLSKVFIWMALGILATGVSTYLVMSKAVQDLQFALTLNSWYFVIFIFQLILTIGISNIYKRTSSGATALMYLGFTALTGLWLGPLLFLYDLEAVLGALIATVFTFFIISVWAVFTKRDLTTWGSFAIMALLGLIFVSLFNFFIFFFSPQIATTISWGLTYVGLGIFMVLLAANMQNLAKLSKSIKPNDPNIGNLAIVGAFDLYLNVLNIFLLLLRIFGRR